MSEIITTGTLLVIFLFLISNYTQKGFGEMSAPLRQFGMFLLEKAPGPAAALFQNEKGSGAKTWMQMGVFWLILAGIGGFLSAWHSYDPTALDSLSNIGWGWDDGSAMAHFNHVAMSTAVFSILLGGALVAHARSTNGQMASEANLSLMAIAWFGQTMFGLFLPLLGSWLDFTVGNFEMALYGLVSAGLIMSLIVNAYITLGSRDNAPIGVSSWFLVLALTTLLFSRLASVFGEVLGATSTVWIADIIANGWVPLALMFAVGYHVIPHVSGKPIWSGSLTLGSMLLLFFSIPPFFLSEAGHADNLTKSIAAILVTLGMFPIIAGSSNLIATMRGNASAVITNPGALAATAGVLLLPLFAILGFFTGLNVMVGAGDSSNIADTANMGFLYTVGGLFCLAALFHSYPLVASRKLEGAAGWATWLVIIGGLMSTILSLMTDWSSNALTEAGHEDSAAAVADFALTGAFAFYGVTIGFIFAGIAVVKTLLSGTRIADGISVSSDVSTYNLVEGSTSIRDLLGRGVGIDTVLTIGDSEEESEGGSTIIEVATDLHNDEVDEFPAELFDEELVELTKWLCGRGTTTAQFFAWADVDDSGEMDLFEFANALRVADIADLPPWDVSKLVDIMDINSDGKINLPELDIALLNIRNKLGIEFVPYEAEEAVEVEGDEEAESEAEEEEEAEEEAEDSSIEAPSKSELKKMKKAELVAVAESMGLDTSGTKADLVERITKA